MLDEHGGRRPRGKGAPGMRQSKGGWGGGGQTCGEGCGLQGKQSGQLKCWFPRQAWNVVGAAETWGRVANAEDEKFKENVGMRGRRMDA